VNAPTLTATWIPANPGYWTPIPDAPDAPLRSEDSSLLTTDRMTFLEPARAEPKKIAPSTDEAILDLIVQSGRLSTPRSLTQNPSYRGIES
jgi:hypothetical protein